ncbi:RHS repeat domain-containing protein [Pseudomonas sp. EA_15y_Pfl1_P102]|uniref:RHS repeat domain-containing protein n=1 Tax=Pseudomonas sp. EA_15y_Pfl1_P102 TaxID=3088685 RepID=UPI0030D78AD3
MRGTRFGHIKDNRLRHWQQYHYRYDAWGNVIERRSTHQRQLFEYDSENRLVHALRYHDGELLNEARYQYDSLGRRTHKQVEIEGALTTTQFLWQGLRLLQETCGGGQQLYIYEPDSYAPLARVDRTDGGKPSLYYFHTDQIGTPLEVTSAQGDLVWQARYKAWGEVERFEAQSVEQHLRFQGQYFDAETGLHYNTFRYYDPGVGRFTTQDPIGLLGGDNLYQYAVNPTGWVDPLGLNACGTTKGNGKFTEPALPPKLIAQHGDVKIVHYTRSGDHGPAHLHVKGGGKETKIGQAGKPIKGAPTSTSEQQAAIDANKSAIRKSVDKIQRWFRFQNR